MAPAASEEQARLFGMAIAFLKGELRLSEVDDAGVRDSIKDIAHRVRAGKMSMEELKEMAST